MVGEGAQVLCGGSRGKFSKLGARSGPHTRSAHLIPSRSDVLVHRDINPQKILTHDGTDFSRIYIPDF